MKHFSLKLKLYSFLSTNLHVQHLDSLLLIFQKAPIPPSLSFPLVLSHTHLHFISLSFSLFSPSFSFLRYKASIIPICLVPTCWLCFPSASSLSGDTSGSALPLQPLITHVTRGRKGTRSGSGGQQGWTHCHGRGALKIAILSSKLRLNTLCTTHRTLLKTHRN